MRDLYILYLAVFILLDESQSSVTCVSHTGRPGRCRPHRHIVIFIDVDGLFCRIVVGDKLDFLVNVIYIGVSIQHSRC